MREDGPSLVSPLPRADASAIYMTIWGGIRLFGRSRYFSNFAESGFDFQVPEWLPHMTTDAKFPVEQVSAPVHCEFSEKAIMLCKAVAMGDAKSYERIARAEHPAKAKRLGRGCVYN